MVTYSNWSFPIMGISVKVFFIKETKSYAIYTHQYPEINDSSECPGLTSAYRLHPRIQCAGEKHLFISSQNHCCLMKTRKRMMRKSLNWSCWH